MAFLKCKMCGGELEVNQGVTVGECSYCGTKQTLPKVNNDVIQNLFNRANNLRIKCDFDKAEQIYEKILQEDDTESEAHWGIVLCKYGIEYVEDPKTYQRIPTCHRTSYDAVTADPEYLAAVANADDQQRSIYMAEARAIDEIQKNILSIVKDEKPFDVFICYKQADEFGKRTVDSSIANDIYYQLTQEGLKVFYAAITLEDKLGQEYEPYIFAALNSAKVMLVVGTKPEYFSAVWVKNEWRRYLKLMKTDRSKLLIPCYRDMDAYDLPEEFSHLQAQDMSKIGFINDVVRGIKKVVSTDAPKMETIPETPVAVAGAAPLLERAFMFLEDGEWNRADEFCEQVLNIDPKNARAYLGKLMAELRVRQQESLKDCAQPFDGNNNYQKAIRFADEKLKAELNGYIEHIRIRNENARLEGIYTDAQNRLAKSHSEYAYKDAAKLFVSISEYKNSAQLAKECYEKAEIARKDDILRDAANRMAADTIQKYNEAIRLLEQIPGWKDADQKLEKCKNKVDILTERAERERQERKLRAMQDLERMERMKARNRKIGLIIVAAIFLLIAGITFLTKVIIPNSKYNNALDLMNEGKYTEAIVAFEALDGYKDSNAKIDECETAILDEDYNSAVELMNSGKYQEAITAFGQLGDYKDTNDKILECHYNIAVAFMNAGNYQEAIPAFGHLGDYKDSEEKIIECRTASLDEKYNVAMELMKAGKYIEAYETLIALKDYKDSTEKANSIYVKYEVEKVKVAKDGDYVVFGSYEQDNNNSNGKEKIEWLVFSKTDGKALLISKYALDNQPYNTSGTNVTWETCTLRKWLNSEFINSAFSSDEKAMISMVEVSEYGDTGNATQDQVFLLSISQVQNIFRTDREKRCEPTNYAVANGVHANDDGYCWWLLRSLGNYQCGAMVTNDGEINDGIIRNILHERNAVRPAMWIDLNT